MECAFKCSVTKFIMGSRNTGQQWDRYRYTFLGGVKVYFLFRDLYIYEVYQWMRLPCINAT